VHDVAVLCPPGFEDIVAEAAGRELPKCVESLRTGGFVRMRTDASVQQLRAFPCATNLFAVIAEVPRTDIEGEAKSLRVALATTPRPSELTGSGKLRLRIHDDGRFVPSASRAALALEEALRSWSQRGDSGRGASLEVWLIRRAGMRSSLLATRLSSGRPRLERGRLRPEVCAALARVEPLAGAQLVMDPFAGSGAIGDACLQAGAQRVWLNDLDAKGASRAERPSAKWTSADFRRLRVPIDSVDAIVTDPPWGRNWKVRRGVGHLYADFGVAARAWLRPGGALVLLTGAPDAAIAQMLEAGKLRSELVLPVLVNGSKATVIRARNGRRRRHDGAPVKRPASR
jgi:16S rRNA G966 N2-methylase RsmD